MTYRMLRMTYGVLRMRYGMLGSRRCLGGEPVQTSLHSQEKTAKLFPSINKTLPYFHIHRPLCHLLNVIRHSCAPNLSFCPISSTTVSCFSSYMSQLCPEPFIKMCAPFVGRFNFLLILRLWHSACYALFLTCFGLLLQSILNRTFTTKF